MIENRILINLKGRPGSGKGELSKSLESALPAGMVGNVTTGEAFRDLKALRGLAAEGADISGHPSYPFFTILQPYFEMMDQGKLIPDEPTIAIAEQLFRRKLKGPNAPRILIADGFPRTGKQFESWLEMTGKFIAEGLIGERVHVGLNVSRETALRRMGIRAKLAGDLARTDDLNRDTQVLRHDIHDEHLEPIIQRLIQRDDIVLVDSEQDKTHVLRCVLEKVVLPRLPDVNMEQALEVGTPSAKIRRLQ